MKLKYYQVEDPIYNRRISFFIGDKKSFNKKLIDFGYKDLQAKGRGKTIIDFEKGRSIIWIESKNIPVLVHEIYHYAVMTFNRASIPLTLEADEVMAYYLEMTLRNILDKIK